jgi:hypothetical protein
MQNSELTIFMVTQNTLPDTAVPDGDRLDGLFAGHQGASGQIRTRFNGMNHVGISGIEMLPSVSGSIVTYRHVMRDDPNTPPPTLVLSYDSLTVANTGNQSFGPVYTNALTPGVSFNLMTIGRADGFSFTGDLAEFVIYRGALTDADFASVTNALAASYGFQPIPEPSALLLVAGALLVVRRRLQRRTAR